MSAPSSVLLKGIHRTPLKPLRYPRYTSLTATEDGTKTATDASPSIPEEMSVHVDERKLTQDMLYRIRDCNRMPDDLRSVLLDFRVDGSTLGKVDPKVAKILCSTSVSPGEQGRPSIPLPVFEMETAGGKTYLTLSKEASGTSPESRTKAVAAVMEELKGIGIITGWRDELYPVSDSFYNPPLFLMERAAVSLLGVLEYGVHVNGILLPEEQQNRLYNDDGNVAVEGEYNRHDMLPLMWMARRSKTKSKYPSMLDQIVAGGQPAGLGLMENVIKECEEEAGIPSEVIRPGINLRPVGVVSYEEARKQSYNTLADGHEDDENSGNNSSSLSSFYTISRVVLFNYDLDLPGDFVPKPVDGEVEDFFLWRIDQIKESMAPDFGDPIKPNCYLVIIDYLLRMGYVSPETDGYLDVFRELRSGDCR